MQAVINSQTNPEDEELERKKASLAALETQLADRELELASLLADLVNFESRYLQSIGRRYAILDDLHAQIAEARARRNPDRPEAREQADKARSQAESSARAAGVEDGAAPLDADAGPKVTQSEGLKKLFRKAAMDFHPDRTLDPDEQKRRHRLFADISDAYRNGDEARLRAILRDWHASPENVSGDGPGAELVRVIRKIAQVEKRLTAIAKEIERRRQGELFALKQSVDEARENGRDRLRDLAEQLDRQIAAAREELKRASEGGSP